MLLKMEAEAHGQNQSCDYVMNQSKQSKHKHLQGFVKNISFDKSMDRITGLINQLIEHYLSLSEGRDRTRLIDPWSCLSCAGVLVDPVTISCGHTYCKKCLLKNTSKNCLKCGAKWEPSNEEEANDPKVTILVSELGKKLWSKDLRAIDLRNEGNKYLQRGDLLTAIRKYSEAVELAPMDHLLAGNRSNAFHRLGKFQAALDDAERSVMVKPDWAKGYFRKGMALQSQEKYKEALIAFFHCLVLEEYCSKSLRLEINKSFYQIFTAGHLYLDDMNIDSDEGSDDESIEPLNNAELTKKDRILAALLEGIEQSVGKLSSSFVQPRKREMSSSSNLVKDDFECSLCFRSLWQPFSTKCGHTFCKSCINRALDHKLECPLCKAPLEGYLDDSNGKVNEFVEETFRRLFSADYNERQWIYEEELRELRGDAIDGKILIPVFVCTMSFPTIPCPLHVFEPRYRLMIRRCMEAGTRQFGMCTSFKDRPFAEYGTMLEIRDIQYFPDGRSVVDTVGGRRFRVFENGTRDGYQTARVQFLTDHIPEGEELAELKRLHDETRSTAEVWFGKLEENIRSGILSHYGDMPALEDEYWNLSSGPAWIWWILAMLPLDAGKQQHILSQALLSRRLEAIARILGFMKR